MKNICSPRLRSPLNKRSKGFSLLELLIALAAISSVVAMAVIHMSSTNEAVKEAKLRQDVAALNRAIRTYRISGGNLSTVSTGTAVLDKLKTTSSTPQRTLIAGLRGTMVDPRMRGVSSSGNGTARAVWDDTTKTFAVQTSGSGFSEFILDDTRATIAPVEETRDVLMAMDNKDKWIWSFADAAKTGTGPRQGPSAVETPVITSTSGGNMTVLSAPDFSRPGALYDYSAFNPDMKVSLVDTNPANTADLYYSIGGGAWQRWNGVPLSIPRALTTQVRAYSVPLDADRFEQSTIADASYETIFFGGTSSGVFQGPIGEPGMITNLSGTSSSPLFTWGSPATTLGFYNPNSLSFSGKNLGTIAPEQLFELGTLSYYNGSVWSGTMANSIKLKVTLNLTTPGVVENLEFTFRLMSTVNTKADKKANRWNTETEQQMDDADADFVYIPDVSTRFNTTIKGQTFYLVLSFGEHTSNGFTTIDTFHTHENETMSGKIYGRFTTTPSTSNTFPDNDDDD
jgi:prepilin-type N-terminal cleavage/methylation domain-containing protein